MAKYTITHSCGCERTYNIIGKHTDRESKIKWLSEQDCPDCKRKAEEEAAKEATEGMELPELEGSVKQVAWANTIRGNMIASAKKLGANMDSVLQILSTVTTARAFIDTRDMDTLQALYVFKHAADQRAKKIEALNAQEPAEATEPAKAEEMPTEAQKAPQKGSEWGKVAINAQNVETTTERGAKIKMPHNSEHDGYSVWVSLKLLRTGRHSYEYMLSVKADMEFTLKKYGQGRYNKKEVIAEKTISAEDMAEAFGGWVENAPRNTRPAVDPDRVEIVKHEPAPLAPVEIEADPELTR